MKYKSHLISTGIATVLFFLCCLWRDAFQAASAELLFHRLCDSAFVVAVLFGGVALLMWAANGGIFDGLVYTGMQLFWIFTPGYEKKKSSRPTYYEYKMRRSDKQVRFGFLISPAVVYFILSVIFLVVFEHFAA